jgi:uncharacterized integral membrane protein (TIGR00698 family)
MMRGVKPLPALFVVLALVTLSGFVTPPVALAAGLAFALTLGNPLAALSQRAAKALLQASVVGLGFGMNLATVWDAGRTGFAFTLATIAGTLLLGTLLGRLLRVESQTSLLVSSGTAICGGSAIAAVGGVIEASPESMSVALATVFILNSIALFVFPPLGHALGMTQRQFGLWAAIAIHDTSSVVGAAARYGDEALRLATTVKLARALWIFPLALGLAAQRRKPGAKVRFPWFILWFVVAAGVRTVFPQPVAAYDALRHAATLGLTLTLFLIGAGLTRPALRAVGPRPLVQGVLLWLAISLASLVAVERFLR